MKRVHAGPLISIASLITILPALSAEKIRAIPFTSPEVKITFKRIKGSRDQLSMSLENRTYNAMVYECDLELSIKTDNTTRLEHWHT